MDRHFTVSIYIVHKDFVYYATANSFGTIPGDGNLICSNGIIKKI